MYNIGDEHSTSRADCNSNEISSFGLLAYRKEEALKYDYARDLYKVAIKIEDIATILKVDNTIRCKKFKVIERVAK